MAYIPFPRSVTYPTDPGTPEVKITNNYYDGNINSRDNLQIVSAGVLTGWLNEWGAFRARQPQQNITDAAVRLIRGSDSLQTGNIIETLDAARTKRLFAVTSEGRVSAPNVKDRIAVIADSDASSTVLEGAYVRSGVTPLGRWYGSGVPTGTVLDTNIYGSRDIPLSTVSTRKPTVTSEALPMTFDTTAQNVSYVFAGTQVVLARFVFSVSAAHSSAWEILRFLNAASPLFRLRLAGTGGTPNRIRIYDAGGTQVAETTGALTSGTTYIINVRMEQGVSNNLVRVWVTDTSGVSVANMDISYSLTSIGGGASANLVTEVSFGTNFATGVSPTATYSRLEVAPGVAGQTSEVFPVLTTETVEVPSRVYVDARTPKVSVATSGSAPSSPATNDIWVVRP